MLNKKLSHNEILLLILYSDNCSSIFGKTRIQKIVFLYEEELHKRIGFNKMLKANDSLFGFYPYNYGPFSDKVPDYLAELEAFSIISLNPIKNKNNSVNNKAVEIIEHVINDSGIKYLESNVLPYVNSIQLDLLTEFKKKYNSMIQNDLMSYVYNTYEKMTTNSLIKDQYIGNEWYQNMKWFKM